MKIKETNTFIIRRPNEHAYKSSNHGELEKDSNNKLVPYSKDAVVSIVNSLVKDGTILKGDKIDARDSKYLVYRFAYEQKDEYNRANVYVHRIKIEKRYLDDNKKYVDLLDSLVKETCKISNQNIDLTNYEFYALVIENDFSLECVSEKPDMQEDNQKRKEDNLPPIGAVYEDGTTFKGTYEQWRNYILGYTDKDGNMTVSTTFPNDEGNSKPYLKD